MYFDGLTFDEAKRLRHVSLLYRRATPANGRLAVAASLAMWPATTLDRVVAQQNSRGFPVAVVGAYCRMLAAAA